MKTLVISFILLSTMSSFGQKRDFNDIPKDVLKRIDRMGIDGSSLLNNHEGTYLNVIFHDRLNGFDFRGKKVGFINGGSKSDKQEYFKEVNDRYQSNNTPPGGSGLYIFDSTQKIESGGYDAALVYWSKFIIPIDKIIKKLKTHNP